jgi:hypothetical protein
MQFLLFFLLMEFKVKFLKTTFDDFYGPGNTNIEEYTGPKYTGRQTPKNQNVYVHDCFFQSCLSSSDGGALSCDSSIYKLLIHQTSFISCQTSSSNGGGIYFYSQTNGQCIMSKVCGYNCSSFYRGQFIYTHMNSNSINYKNHANDTSITRSLGTDTSSRITLDLYYGNILCPSVNLTNNICYYHTALLCAPTSSDTCRISYSSIVNNTANDNTCIYFYNSATSHYVESCNILNNNQTSSSSGIIYSNTNVNFKDSCIFGNDKINNIFYVSSSSYKITISNCTIDDDIFTNGRYYGSVTVIKTLERTFINALSHIVTRNCDSYFDSYGTLSVKPNTPSKSSRCLLSCNIKPPIIDGLRIVQLLFLLTFLPHKQHQF